MDSPLNSSSVLIVEDDHMVLSTIKLTLESEHFDVVSSTSPIQALTLLPDRDFAVIISDHKMPEMMGLDFLVECRRLRPQSSRILLTAVLDLATAVDAINRGEICRFISKPWMKAELVSAVRDAIQRHELACQNQQLQAEACRLNQELTASNRALQARVAELERRPIQAAEALPAGR
jgi:DNA-binding NtrC family response regulator